MKQVYRWGIIIVVITVIIAGTFWLMAPFIWPGTVKDVRNAQRVRAKQLARTIAWYYYNEKEFPARSELARTLMNSTNEQGLPYLPRTQVQYPTNKTGEILDRDRTPYRIEMATNRVVVISAGKNGKFGDSDDIKGVYDFSQGHPGKPQ